MSDRRGMGLARRRASRGGYPLMGYSVGSGLSRAPFRSSLRGTDTGLAADLGKMLGMEAEDVKGYGIAAGAAVATVLVASSALAMWRPSLKNIGTTAAPRYESLDPESQDYVSWKAPRNLQAIKGLLMAGLGIGGAALLHSRGMKEAAMGVGAAGVGLGAATALTALMPAPKDDPNTPAPRDESQDPPLLQAGIPLHRPEPEQLPVVMPQSLAGVALRGLPRNSRGGYLS